ncbi:MAG TPA: helix-turn-helix domain-containing protein [Thermoleophilaceae bacterium]|nr:helix-turn-helix domain-containing protein [Thermoleophilaceae bacterium]
MPSIGDTLREARMRQRLDIADVEAKTKIRAKYLRALESEEWDLLPGPTFVKTFLRSYAEVLGLDPHLLVEDYRARYEPRDDAEALKPLGPPGIGRDRRRRAPRPPGPLLLAGLAVAAVLGTLLVVGLVGEEDDPGEAAQEETTTQPRRERPERRERPPRPRRVALRIAPEVETYVCIDTGAGTEVRFEGILTEPQTFRGRRLRVNLGNTSVAVTMNGEPVEVGSGAEPVGFEFRPGSTTPVPLGERPCA